MARNTICVGVYRQFVRQSRKTADLNDADERSFPRRRAVLARRHFNARSFVRTGSGPELVGFALVELDEIAHPTERFGIRPKPKCHETYSIPRCDLIWNFK